MLERPVFPIISQLAQKLFGTNINPPSLFFSKFDLFQKLFSNGHRLFSPLPLGESFYALQLIYHSAIYELTWLNCHILFKSDQSFSIKNFQKP